MLTFDMRAFEQAARNMKGAQDQVAFAVSVALNKAVLNTENRLARETWASHTANRNKGFLRAALAPEFSDKKQLRVALFDSLGRAKLYDHSHGGTAAAKGRFAIPTSRVTRTGKGVRQTQKPANLKNKVVLGGLIFQAVGRGKNKKLQLMFTLKNAVQIKKDVPLVEDFNRFMREEARREFPKAMLKAMRTRR
jgi:G3E family GTPase